MAKEDDGPKMIKEVLGDTVPEQQGVWWELNDKEIGPAAVRTFMKYETAGQDRREANRRYTQLWAGKLVAESMLDSGRAPTLAEDLNPAWNVVQAAINTAMSVVCRNNVRSMILTNGADYELQDMAKLAEDMISGAFRGSKVYEKLDKKWFLGAGTAGLGIMGCEPNSEGKPEIRCILPDCAVYNEVEWIDGNGREFAICEWRPKWKVLEEYGDGPNGVMTKAILDCTTSYKVPLVGTPGAEIPVIPVWTCWFIKTPTKVTYEKDKDDKVKAKRTEYNNGRRVVALPNVTLSVRPYKWNRLPLEFLRIEDPLVGLWGIGMAQRASGYQYRIHEINSDIDEARRMGSTGKWVIDTAANVNEDELTNEQGAILHYSGGPDRRPLWVTNDGVPKSLYEERQMEYDQCLKEFGLSEWSVSGVQPDNVDSGEGLKVLEQKEQGRAVPVGQNWESAHVGLAEIVIMAALDGFEMNPDLEVWAEEAGAKEMTKLRFEEVAKLLTSPDSWKLQAYPTDFLSSSPAVRFKQVKEWEAKGWIDAASAAALTDMPDLNQEASLLLAGVKAVRYRISQIKRRGQAGYEPPNPNMPLLLGARIAQATVLEGERTGLPEDRIQLLEQWGKACRDLAAGNQGPVVVPTAPAPGMAAPNAPVAPVNAPAPPPGANGDPAAPAPLGAAPAVSPAVDGVVPAGPDGMGPV